MKLSQGIWVVGEFDGTSERTVRPKADGTGKQFEPFKVEELRIIQNDEPRTIEYREGKLPSMAEFALGEVIVVPVRVREVFNGTPRFDGRSAAVLANE